jgi:two-component system cell cycle sensor histidine kinase/response regulator CckA
MLEKSSMGISTNTDPLGRVLVIDDSRVVREYVSEELRNAGFAVDEAEGGPSAMRLLSARVYDVIVTDLHMPEPDGFGILETVRIRKLDSEVVVITGSHAGDINAAIRALRLGACDYLTKPFAGGDQLVVAVERALLTKRQREELRIAQEKYRDLFDSVPIGLYRSAPNGIIVNANLALVQLLSFPSREELLATNAKSLYVNPADRETWMRRLERDGLVSGVEVRLRRGDGTIVWMEENARAHYDEKGNVIQYEGSLQDVTERRRAKQELHEAQKMEAIGRLAGGIAHDFNNALGIVLGATGLMARRRSLDAALRRDIERIQTAAEKAGRLTRQLLAFSRKQVLQPKQLDLNSVVRGTRDMLRSLIGERIELQHALVNDVCMVKADPSQIEQVIVNLIVNACDAMPDGGHLMIETAHVKLDASRLQRFSSARPGDYVMLAVTDTGTGMDKETLSHVFEPFFTTKKRNKGTGLGLSTAYGIVEQSGGCIWAYSEVGIGSCFKVFLPRIPMSVDAGRTQIHGLDAHEPVVGGHETILVVEDEDDLRELLCQGLKSCGYRVFSAPGGTAALDLAQKHRNEIDLLVTDLVMPQMSGTTVAATIRKLDKKIKILYISGYADAAAMTHRGLPRGAAFLQKPFTLDTLVERVRDILDTSEPK